MQGVIESKSEKKILLNLKNKLQYFLLFLFHLKPILGHVFCVSRSNDNTVQEHCNVINTHTSLDLYHIPSIQCILKKIILHLRFDFDLSEQHLQQNRTATTMTTPPTTPATRILKVT